MIKRLSRRDVIKGGLAIPATSLLSGSAVMTAARSMAVQTQVVAPASPRERLAARLRMALSFRPCQRCGEGFRLRQRSLASVSEDR